MVLLLAAVSALAASPAAVDRVVVLKREHKMMLLSGTEMVKSYSVALGRGGLGAKQRQGDRRTPEGTYRIDWRNPSSKFHLALHISYPRQLDRVRAASLRASPGANIEIHGLPPAFSWVGSNHRIVDWTDGCIAVTDSEIEEIWQLVPDGTLVEIRP